VTLPEGSLEAPQLRVTVDHSSSQTSCMSHTYSLGSNSQCPQHATCRWMAKLNVSTNQEMEQFLHLFVNEHQDDWDKLLPMGQVCVQQPHALLDTANPIHGNHWSTPLHGLQAAAAAVTCGIGEQVQGLHCMGTRGSKGSTHHDSQR
jgi:hypothetical protein